jgi:hypothetical protein
MIVGLALGMLVLPAEDAAPGGGPGPLQCKVVVEHRANSVILSGIVTARINIKGSYELRASRSSRAGASNVSQSGGFSVGPAAPVSLGAIMLGGSGGVYVARLKLTWNGGSLECAQRSGGII